MTQICTELLHGWNIPWTFNIWKSEIQIFFMEIIYSNMTSFKRFGSKPVVKYAYIGILADRQRHNLFWLLYKKKYRICSIRIEIIHGGLDIYWFYHGLALYADILPLAIARGKIFGIKGQPMVKSVYIQAPMNYFLSSLNKNAAQIIIGVEHHNGI